MNAATSVKQDIFELVLDFYRKPSDFPDLLDCLKPLPEGITDLLELTAGEVEARSKILSRAAASEAPSELVDATSYFSEQVLFAPGGDHYRVLGLNHDSSIDDIREHYELLVRLFYQDKENNSIQSNETDFSRLNRAYSVLRDEKKRAKYNQSLKTQGRLQQLKKEDSNSGENIPRITTTNVQLIDTYVSTPEKADVSRPDESVFVEDSDNKPDRIEPGRAEHNATKTPYINVAGSLPKILIVDDSATVRAGLSLTLNKEFECITAKNGEKAWKKLQQMNDILLILTDLDMPELNGYDLIKRIRQSNDERIKTLPVIVVTGTENIDIKQKALNAGADDFLAKSTDFIEVLTRIRVHYHLVKTKQQLNESRMKPAPQIVLNPRFDTGPGNNYGPKKITYPRTINGATDYLEHKKGLKNIITIGAFGLVAVVLVALLYLTQIKPAGETNTAIKDEISDTDPSLPEPASKISRVDVENAISMNDVQKINKDGTSSLPDNTPVDKNIANKEVNTITKKLAIPEIKQEIKKPKPVVSQETPLKRVTQKADKEEEFKVTSATTTKIKPQINKPVSKFESPTISELILKEEKEANKRIAVTPATEKKKAVTADNRSFRNPVSENSVSKNFVSENREPNRLSTAVLPSRDSTSFDNKSPDRSATPFAPVTPATSVPKSTVAFADPAASLIARPRISQRELALLIFRFIRSYEDGNLFQFMRLFSENAKTEDNSTRLSIEADYKDLFSKSAARRFILGDLDWKYNNDVAEGNGFFEVKIWPKGGDQFKTFTGEVTITVLKTEAEGLVITGLFHNF